MGQSTRNTSCSEPYLLKTIYCRNPFPFRVFFTFTGVVKFKLDKNAVTLYLLYETLYLKILSSAKRADNFSWTAPILKGSSHGWALLHIVRHVSISQYVNQMHAYWSGWAGRERGDTRSGRTRTQPSSEKNHNTTLFHGKPCNKTLQVFHYIIYVCV
jgi:hypothetical protein